MLIRISRRTTRKNATSAKPNFFKSHTCNAEENGNITTLVLLLEVTISKEAMFDKIYLVHTVFYLISLRTI
jgi:hypothetical protein